MNFEYACIDSPDATLKKGEKKSLPVILIKIKNIMNTM